MKIGIFDSGVGGLTVVKEILNLNLNLDIIYFGDTARTPYGTKSPDTIRKYALEDAEFLISKGANIIVIACHSAASVSTQLLKEKLNIPIFEVISPSRDLAAKSTKNKRIGLIGTRATVDSKIYEQEFQKIDPEIKLYSKACPLLVPLVEEGWLKNRETRMIIRKYLRPLKMLQIDTLILGCTHYPIIKKVISEIAGKKITIIDPSLEVAKAVKAYLENTNTTLTQAHKPTHQFYLSDISPITEQIAKNFLGKKVEFQRVIL